MHINMKYYVVSIGAIFISLGIGVLVGFNINDNELLYQQQSQIIEDLEGKFDNFQTLNKELESELTTINEDYSDLLKFVKVNYSKLTSEGLVDKSVGIVSTNDKNQYTKNLSQIIQDAGGNVSFDITINNDVYNEENLKDYSEQLAQEFNDINEFGKYIANSIATKDKEALNKLQEINLIQINSFNEEYNEYSDIVLAGGNDGKLQNNVFEIVDLNLINAFKETEKNIVGVQESISEVNYSNLYFEQKISSVDNIDDELGKLSLILLLQNSNTLGQFGTSENAESLIPYDIANKEN